MKMNMNLYGFTFNLVNVVIALLLGMFIGSSLLCACSKVSVKEGLAMLGGKIYHQSTKLN